MLPKYMEDHEMAAAEGTIGLSRPWRVKRWRRLGRHRFSRKMGPWTQLTGPWRSLWPK